MRSCSFLSVRFGFCRNIEWPEISSFIYDHQEDLYSSGGGGSKQVKQRSLLINQRGKEKVSLLNSGLQEIMAKGIIISRELYFHSLYLSDDGCVQVFMGPQPRRVKALWSSGGASPEK